MNKYLKSIKNATLEILNECPKYIHNDNTIMYLLESYEYDVPILVMFDTFYYEFKTTYIDKHGIYINGRSNSDDPSKIYLNDFDEFSIDDDNKSKVDDKISEIKYNLDARIPSRDIKAGYICHEYNKKTTSDWYTLYLGKVSCKEKNDYNSFPGHVLDEINKRNVYINIGHSIEDVDSFNVSEYRYSWSGIPTKKSKIRFDKVVRKLKEDEINILRDYFENGDKYENFKWYK